MASAIPPTDDELLADAHPSALVKLAAGCLLGTALLGTLSGVQMLGFQFRAIGWLDYAPYALLGVGVVSGALGISVYRGRAWAAAAVVPLSALAALTFGGFMVVTVLNTMISPLVILAGLLSVVAGLASPLAMVGVRKMAGAREQLADRGLDMGL